MTTEEKPKTCTSNFQANILEANSTFHKASEIIIDCGTSNHFCPDKSKFITYETIPPEPIKVADGRSFSALGKGDIEVWVPNGEEDKTRLLLRNTLYAPNLAYTLLSVSTIDRAGFYTEMGGGECKIMTATKAVIGRVPLIANLYRIPGDARPGKEAHVVTSKRGITLSEFHRRMGQVHHDALKQMVQKRMVKGIKVNLNHPEDFCESCLKAKAPCHPFPKESKTVYTKYGEKVVADLWGPAQVESLTHNHYYTLYHDLHSSEEKVYFQRLKSQTFTNYKKYEAVEANS